MRELNWKYCELGDVLTLQRGFDLPERERKQGNIPIISSSGVSGSHDTAKIWAPGVVTGRYGTLGEVFYIKKAFWPLNTTLYVKDFKGNDPLYLSYFLKTLNLAQQNSAGAVPGLNRNALHKLPVCIPPLSTQHKIASILSAYDDLIENNTQRIAILEEIAQSLYQEWFVYYRFPGNEKNKMIESELGMIPEGWRVVSFSEIANVLSGGTPKTTESDYWNGDIPFFTPKDASSSFFVLKTEKKITVSGLNACSSKLYPRDTVFITARGTVGKVFLSAVDMAMNQSCYALQGKENIPQYFLFMHIRNCIDQLKQGAHGAVFDTIIIDTFKRLKVVMPSDDSINSFFLLLSPVFEQILTLLRKNDNLSRTRNLLLPKLVSGEINVERLADKDVIEEDAEHLLAVANQ